MARQLHEKCRAKVKKIYFSFVDVEKAFDRVPGEVSTVINSVAVASTTCNCPECRVCLRSILSTKCV